LAWSDALLTKLNSALGSRTGLANELTQNLKLLNYFEGVNANWWYKLGLLRDHYRSGGSSITLPDNFKAVVEALSSGSGRSLADQLAARGGKSAEQLLGEILEEDLLPQVGLGFTNGGNFAHLPPSVANRLDALYKDGYQVMVTQVQCVVNGKSPIPDMVLFKKNALNDQLNFNDVVAIDSKLNVDYGYDATDPQRILALTQGTGQRFEINSNEETSDLYGNTSTLISQIKDISSTLGSFSKIGTALENDIYTLLHKPYNPR
jgi:hypothetical protein